MTAILDEEILAELTESKKIIADFQPTSAQFAEARIAYDTVCETLENRLRALFVSWETWENSFRSLPQMIKLAKKIAPALHRPLTGVHKAATGAHKVLAEVREAQGEIRAARAEIQSLQFLVPIHRGLGPTRGTKLGRPPSGKALRALLWSGQSKKYARANVAALHTPSGM
jgi:hypothetical protein